ncbi:MAG: DsbA family protein [Bacteroidia bacterium]|nr:DsbA family protein [Bacteroidia bacterium]
MSDKKLFIYAYDALCGWCYGFSTVMEKVNAEWKDRLDFEVLSGGMMQGVRSGPIGVVAPYVKTAYKTVEERTGIKFGEGFINNILEPGTAVLNSIPPAIALSVFKSYFPDKQIQFASALQKAINYDGIDMEDFLSYKKYAEDFGIDGNEFVSKMSKETYLLESNRDFQMCANLGVTGFPAAFILKDEVYHQVAKGYIPFEQINDIIKTVMES